MLQGINIPVTVTLALKAARERQIMGSKKFKGKICVYCAQPGASKTADHVIPSSFFLPDKHANLPQVPACEQCNNTKSKLENYLAAVMPLCGQHADAANNLASQVPKRFKNKSNLRLVRDLVDSCKVRYVPCNDLPWEMTLPFDGHQAEAFFRLVTKGLVYHHYEKLVLPDQNVLTRASFITAEDVTRFAPLWEMNEQGCIHNDLGNGTFTYRAVQSKDYPSLTIWQMSLYGAMVRHRSDRGARVMEGSTVLAFTMPNTMPFLANQSPDFPLNGNAFFGHAAVEVMKHILCEKH